MAIGLVAELLVYTHSFFWQIRRGLAGFSLIISAIGAGMFAVQTQNAFGASLAFLMIYRVINCLRLVDNRVNEEYLKRVTTRTFCYLAGAQIIILVSMLSLYKFTLSFDPKIVYVTTAVTLLFASVIVMISTTLNIKSTKLKVKRNLQLKDTPTVTLAIAARNEDFNLQECLDLAVNSDYPKLEIIVLDDCSQDKTAQIIKDFAQHGVRFVQSSTLDNTWLAKNKAYETLLQQASGDVMMFMGVDARLGVTTISQLLEALTNKHVDMLSVMPERTASGVVAAFVQPMRYWWELAIPRKLLKRPPVLSTCWLIKRRVLLKMGGFKAVTHAIIPEEHLARELSKKNKYAFGRSNSVIGLTTQKDFADQWDTAVRTRYPQLHRRPELAALRSILMLVFLLLPFIAFFASLFLVSIPNTCIYLYGLSSLFLVASHLMITASTNKEAVLLSVFNFPIIALLDLAALHISMYRYEFGEVIWKGRNVSTPVMHIVSHLPPI